jgi:type II secretory ATPase GspE/PulE/Tfp pilus assembly ATPase PilB-like protein
MGVEPYLVASAVIGVGGQRLVRKICPSCKTAFEPTGEIAEILSENGFENSELFQGKGCLTCRRSGYSGRTAIHEIMTINEEIHNLILQSASARSIRQASIRAGMRTMRLDGVNKAVKGVTTIEEVIRLTRSEEIRQISLEKGLE